MVPEILGRCSESDVCLRILFLLIFNSLVNLKFRNKRINRCDISRHERLLVASVLRHYIYLLGYPRLGDGKLCVNVLNLDRDYILL